MNIFSDSCIDGVFNGWSGESVYKLANGQVWQQAAYSYRYCYLYRPRIRILKYEYGYEMEVDGLEYRMPVKRIY
ncbi:MAG: hypothetical protein Q8942_07585 [Bacillota bacterium]|nr:hypothetical protein [Bacillota bacterium]